jgi:hypothetical protein
LLGCGVEALRGLGGDFEDLGAVLAVGEDGEVAVPSPG